MRRMPGSSSGGEVRDVEELGGEVGAANDSLGAVALKSNSATRGRLG